VEVSDSIIGDKNVLEQVLLSDAEKIRRTLDSVDRHAFDEAVDKIINANRVYIIGVRSSATLAGFLHYNLRKSAFFNHISAENIAHFKKKYYLCTRNPK
jgi:DNA-binding MurR/RpiR family transcriptional regulator